MNNRYTDETKIYRDAQYISDGACNPVAVSGSLHDAMRFVLHEIGGGHSTVINHPAVRVMLDHLNVIVFGSNHPAAGPEYDVVAAEISEKV